MISTFGMFTVCRLGIMASQKALSVTGNNIGNINTEGYTRQTLKQNSFYTGGADRYYSQSDVRIGAGAVINGTTQLRDPYLDIRYRNEMSSVGAMDTKLDGLDQIASVLDEVGKGLDGEGLFEDELNNVITQLQALTDPDAAGQKQNDTLVRSSVTALCSIFHTYATKLDNLKETWDEEFHNDLDDVNTILRSIRSYNAEIRKASIFGSDALEQRDERNVLIDKLSELVKIDVLYTEEDIGNGETVEKLVIKTANEPQRTLVDGIYASQLSVRQVLTVNEDGEEVLVDSPNYDLDLSELMDNYGTTIEPTATDTGWIIDLDENGEVQYDEDGNPLFIQGGGEDDLMDKEDADNLLRLLQNASELPLKGEAHPDGTIPTFRYVVKESEGFPGRYQLSRLEVFKGDAQLSDVELYGTLQADREMLTEEGEFSSAEQIENDPDATSKRGIPYYQHAWDNLAKMFASIFNKNNISSNTSAEDFKQEVGEDGVLRFVVTDSCALTDEFLEVIVDEDGNPTGELTNLQWEHLVEYGHGFPINIGEGGVLISNNGNGNDGEGITASNISVSHQWSVGDVRILLSQDPDAPSTMQDNIRHILTEMQTTTHEFFPQDVVGDANSTEAYFTGTLQDALTDMWNILSSDQKVTTSALSSYATSADELYVERDAVMGVDLNDEAMNMIQFQKSYAAACRLLTVYDTILEKLINGTGVTT